MKTNFSSSQPGFKWNRRTFPDLDTRQEGVNFINDPILLPSLAINSSVYPLDSMGEI